MEEVVETEGSGVAFESGAGGGAAVFSSMGESGGGGISVPSVRE